MVTQVNYSEHTLEPGEARALPRRNCLTVCAIDHPLWLSQQGRLADIVVAAGDCVTLTGRGLVVVQSFGERTSFRVASAATLRDRLVALARRYLHGSTRQPRTPRASAACHPRPFLSAVWPP